MSKNHKLLAVIRHEFMTIIKQPSFWISLIAVPLIMGFIILVSMLTDDKDKDIDPTKNRLNVAVIDNSKVVTNEAAQAFELKIEPAQKQSDLEAAVRAGELDGLIVYPSSVLQTGSYQLFADNTDNDKAEAIVTALGRQVLQQSLLTSLNPEQRQLAISGGEGTMQSYTDGHPTRGFSEYIVPGAFLVVFYIVLVFSVGYALSSVSEEKENRSIEMVLSYVKPQTLIFGKLLSIIMVTLTQIACIGAMAGAAYLVFLSLGNKVSLPFNASDLTFVPAELVIGVGFLVVGFVFYVALMAMIGAIFPSSKEANAFSTVFFILPAIPFWSIGAITAQDPGLFGDILTYFPLTSPTTALLRNTVGNIGFLEGMIARAILAATALATIWLAAKAFRLGTLEFADRIKFRSLFGK